jgi:hypothetical protein
MAFFIFQSSFFSTGDIKIALSDRCNQNRIPGMQYLLLPHVED